MSKPSPTRFYPILHDILYVYCKFRCNDKISMVAIRHIWIFNDDEFGPSKLKLFAIFAGDIIAYYYAKSGPSKLKLFEALYGSFIGDNKY